MTEENRYALDELLTINTAAEYLGVSRWWLERRLNPYIEGNDPPEPVGKIDHMDVWTREQLDTLGPLPKYVWPEYVCGGDTFGWEWKRHEGYVHPYWSPEGMAAGSADDARANAEAWRRLADEWDEMILDQYSR
jgi:hypothetical protein